MLFRNQVWNSAVLEVRPDAPFSIRSARMVKLFSSRVRRRERHAIHTQADPFLIVDAGALYLFLETQRVARPGAIEAYRTEDLEHWQPLGTVLKAGHHISYPHVFRSSSGIHLLPETSAAHEVALYDFEDFPLRPRKSEVLLKGAYTDPTIFLRDGLWWLFVTSDDGLELFTAPMLHGPFRPHPANPITNDPFARRCGGPIVQHEGEWFRPAQDCVEEYGSNLSFYKIEAMDERVYEERLAHPDIFDRAEPWRSSGAHHFSMVDFGGRKIAAVDGRQQDYWINKPLSLIMKVTSS